MESQLEGAAADVFGPGERQTEKEKAAVDLKSLHAKIGELTLANDLYERSSVKWRYIMQPPSAFVGHERDSRSSSL